MILDLNQGYRHLTRLIFFKSQCILFLPFKMRAKMNPGRLVGIICLWVASTAVCLSDETDIKAGEDLYNQNCLICHQADAIGKPGMAPSLTNKELLATASDEFFIKTIQNGRPGTGMPPWKHLGEDNIRKIVAYLRSHSQLPNRADEIDKQVDAHGDPRLGKQWFQDICATCHGVKGDGYLSGGTGTAIGKKGFLDVASDGFIRTTIKEGRSNTRMRGFQGTDGLANLSDREIDDIIVYMRSLPKENQ
jgi:mono/diheme cytochrome c family protein